MKKKRFIVLGLGTFGKALALRLSKNGCQVTGVDADENVVATVQDRLYEALVANVTDRSVLEQLLCNGTDGVFISLGEDITKSILAALHVLELGAKQVSVKGVTSEHGRILKKLGVHRVIFPEVEIAEQTADQQTWTSMVGSFQLDPDYSLVEVAAPASLAGKTLKEADLPRRHGLIVIGVKEAMAPKWDLMPKTDHVFSDEQLLWVFGHKANINSFCQMQ
jgi:trk system potassium uptake protein TrkA